jgi:hypothetical protein
MNDREWRLLSENWPTVIPIIAGAVAAVRWMRKRFAPPPGTAAMTAGTSFASIQANAQAPVATAARSAGGPPTVTAARPAYPPPTAPQRAAPAPPRVPPPPPLPAPPARPPSPLAAALRDPSRVRTAVILAEVLGPPLALR